jgi:Papain-like cysteine protease AvrRpt2
MAISDFEIEPQLKDQWCWAAVAASICGFYRDNPVPSQCGLANQFLFPSEDCCPSGDADGCNIPFALDLVLNQLGHLVQPTRGVVSFDDLNDAVTTNSKPVVVRLLFSDLITAHFVVVVGCALDDSGQQIVRIADPCQTCSNVTSMPYSALSNDFKPGATWTDTYFTS